MAVIPTICSAGILPASTSLHRNPTGLEAVPGAARPSSLLTVP